MFLKRILYIVTFLFLLVGSNTLQAEPTIAAGKDLFNANCAACHAKNMKDKATGPALSGVEDRWSAFPRTDLYKWIRSSQSLVASGHPYATKIFAEYNKSIMTNFPNLTDEQIESLLLYINNPVVAGPKPPSGGEVQPVKQGFPWLYAGIAALLLLLSFALGRIITNLRNYNRVKEGKEPFNPTLKEIFFSRSSMALWIFGLTLIFGYKTIDNATKMGREQGYQPDQPINFSHKIHAGVNKIDCQYCHDTARRSKHASIPGASTCMNCHSAVNKGTISGTSEITKIYASIGYDPISGTYIQDYDKWDEAKIEELYKRWIGQEYVAKKSIPALDEAGRALQEDQWQGIVKALKNDSNGKIQGPIEWVRIHNLADHAYFNHAQHVSVGKVECQKCHGKIEEMDVVAQYSTLGMGWCVNCHRETPVQFKENAFYKQYERYHKELAIPSGKEGHRKAVTVEDIGGLECQKCHY